MDEQLNIEYQDGGLRCDNTKCDWEDKTIGFDNYEKWINAECPKCGENVLTETDFKNAKKMHEMVKYINGMSKEELEEFNKAMAPHVQDDPIVKALMEMDEDTTVTMTVDTHKGISIDNIEVENNEEE